MVRKRYTDGFKINLMKEFSSREIEIVKFAAEKNIPLGTFVSLKDIHLEKTINSRTNCH